MIAVYCCEVRVDKGEREGDGVGGGTKMELNGWGNLKYKFYIFIFSIYFKYILKT
jgi:hypothetical protein